MPNSLQPEDARYCRDIVRDHAPDLYLPDLLLPNHIATPIFVLHAFHAEIAGIAARVSEPIAGEVRIQWWRDVFSGERSGEAAANPLSRSLLAVCEEYELSRQAFLDKLDAHVFDFYANPMADIAMLEGYLGATQSALFQLSARIACADDISAAADASGHSGMAWGLVDILKNTARQRGAGQIFFPLDLLKSADLTEEEFLAEPDDRHSAAARAMADLAADHHAKAVLAIAKLPRPLLPVYRRLALLPPYLKQVARKPADVLTGHLRVSQLQRQWALFRAR